jgi:hypothetical protein
MNTFSSTEICQAYYTYAKEIGGSEGDSILDRLEAIGFLGNAEIKSDSLTGQALLIYDTLKGNALPFELRHRKSPI